MNKLLSIAGKSNKRTKPFYSAIYKGRAQTYTNQLLSIAGDSNQNQKKVLLKVGLFRKSYYI